MSKSIRMGQTLSLLTAVMTVMAICWVAGCAKTSGREAVPEIRDTLTVISDTLSEIPDTRDGKTYRTVMIGKQVWMAENLNYATSSGSWCYDNDPSNCDKYGRLYDWKTAMAGASSSSANPSGVQGICPSGWHLPSAAEWDVLGDSVGDSKNVHWNSWYCWPGAGKRLKAKSGWKWDDDEDKSRNGTDYYGFSALPGGNRDYEDGHYYNVGNGGIWWAATEDNSSSAYTRYIDYDDNGVNQNLYVKDYGFSVRCVRDKSAVGASSQKGVGYDSVGIEMVFVKGGTFRMGCTNEQGSDCFDDEKPAHSVTVSDFYIGKYEITQKQWREVMGSLPSSLPSSSSGYGDNYPVYYVSWNDIAGKHGFIATLNRQTGKNYRLPTEAEWEYAARGGASNGGYKYSGSNNIDSVAWYDENSDSTTHTVGGKFPNELGIYDMSGNVWEWVSDWYNDSYTDGAQTNPKGPDWDFYRVYRGGSWYDSARDCRVSNRDFDYPDPDTSECDLGFRLVLSP